MSELKSSGGSARKRRRTAASLAALALAAAAPLCVSLYAPAAAAAMVGAQPGHGRGTLDPFEPLNRILFRLHQALDAAMFRPAAVAYARLAPAPVRTALHNAVVNLGEPRTAVNDALQGRALRTLKSLVRFGLNTTLGVGGLFDIAGRGGLPAQPNDFGVTLAHLGVPSGPYLFIPLVGPSTVRDAFGGLADLGLNPLTYIRYPGDTEIAVGSVVTDGLYQRAAADGDLKAMEASATDLYASYRSYYLQNREAAITGGRIDLDRLPDFDEEAPQTPAAQPPETPSTKPTPSATAAIAPPAVPRPAELGLWGLDAPPSL
jgi:phospholipid-binding lipoprotein MlaA